MQNENTLANPIQSVEQHSLTGFTEPDNSLQLNVDISRQRRSRIGLHALQGICLIVDMTQRDCVAETQHGWQRTAKDASSLMAGRRMSRRPDFRSGVSVLRIRRSGPVPPNGTGLGRRGSCPEKSGQGAYADLRPSANEGSGRNSGSRVTGTHSSWHLRGFRQFLRLRPRLQAYDQAQAER